MADQRQKNKRFTSAAGIFAYPRLDTPDTKFDSDGVYKCNLILSEADAQPFIDAIEKETQAHLAAFTEKNGKPDPKKPRAGKVIKVRDPAYGPELDKDGKATGNIVFRTKSKAQIKDSKTQEIIKIRPQLFDGLGKPLKPGTKVGGGSTGKLAVELAPSWTALAGYGISLRLRAAQVITLVEFGQGNAGSFGFGDEGGYDGSEQESSSENSDAASEEFQAPEGETVAPTEGAKKGDF